MTEPDKKWERCEVCGQQVYRDQCGSRNLPTIDGKTNHFLTCKPLVHQLQKSQGDLQTPVHKPRL
jgi:hypothetical protein